MTKILISFRLVLHEQIWGGKGAVKSSLYEDEQNPDRLLGCTVSDNADLDIRPAAYVSGKLDRLVQQYPACCHGGIHRMV